MWRNLKSVKPDSASLAEPLTTTEFNTLMRKFEPVSSRLAIAVSGGPDSLALAWHIRNWTFPHLEKMLGFIVDHGLRKDSGAEAHATAEQLEALGLETEILSWQHAPVSSRLHLTARKARYDLLIEACHRHNIQDLFMAHQREDQAETILMRLAKGSGIDGLAGIPAEANMQGVRLLRPFLEISKERLIVTCDAAHLQPITDPSNLSPKFARGRLRRVMPLLANEGLTVDRLVDLGERAAGVKSALDYYTTAFLRVATRMDISGALHMDPLHLRSTPEAIAERALAICLKAFQAKDYAPERASLRLLLSSLTSDEDQAARTLQGCLISKNSRDIVFTREEAAITDRAVIHEGETVLWDGRWQVTLAAWDTPSRLSLHPLGNPPHEILDRLAPGLRDRIPQGRLRASLPALQENDRLVLIPSLTGSGPATAQLLTSWPPSAQK